jgi:hypothetical protein
MLVPRFVILEHDHPQLHWDLMLEFGEALRTWRLAEPPEPGRTVAAEAIGDHRRLYLDYEGPVSGNRGQVRRWDSGTYEGELPVGAAPDSRTRITLHGERVRGEAILEYLDLGQWTITLSAIDDDRS